MLGISVRLSLEFPLGYVSYTLKLIAKTFDIPVVCLVQLNSEVEKRAGQRPILADLRDSGEIEQDADSVIFINRLPNKPEDVATQGIMQNDGELVLAKQRNGQTGAEKVRYTPHTTKYNSLTTVYKENPSQARDKNHYNETKADTNFDAGYKDGEQFPF